jgi:hypothetical protein
MMSFDPFDPPADAVPPQAVPDEMLERAVTQSYDYLVSRHDKAVEQGTLSVRVNRAELFLILSTFKTLTDGLKGTAD